MQATQDKVQALVRLSEAERSQTRSSNLLESLKKQNQDLSHRLSQATQEKVNALMQLAADGNSNHAVGSGKGSVPSPQKSSTWKVQFSWLSSLWFYLLVIGCPAHNKKANSLLSSMCSFTGTFYPL